MRPLIHKKVHFVGIGGIGMSALAKLLLANGCVVSGSNMVQNDQVDLLKNRGVKIFLNHAAENLENNVEAVIHTSAVNDTNVEIKKAKDLSLPIFDYHEYLGLVAKQYKTIAISGTHGKSTTTAIVASILTEAGFDPTVIVGSKVPGFDGNFRLGASDYLVVEADEFNYGMMHLWPEVLLLNNIEADHLDCYKNLENIINSFAKFVGQISNNGCLIYNNNDQNILSFIDQVKIKKIGVGRGDGGVLYQKNSNNTLVVNGRIYEHQLWGDYNDTNLAMAITLANYLQIDNNKIVQAIKNFSGLWRRFEVLSNNALNKNITIISDYAHHPTALSGVIKASQERYPQRRIWTIFQPHHYDRVSNFFDDFIASLKLASQPVVVKTYDVPGREGDGVRKKTASNIADAIENCLYLDDVLTIEEFIKNNVANNDVVLLIGAGTIDDIARKII